MTSIAPDIALSELQMASIECCFKWNCGRES